MTADTRQDAVHRALRARAATQRRLAHGRGEREGPRRPNPSVTRLALRLAADEVAAQSEGPRPRVTQPLVGDADPRWVLAVRTAEQLQGEVLPPDRRDRLIRLGRTMGLSIFDSNLVIAVVQDQARRGHRGHACATAGEAHLGLIGGGETDAVRGAWSPAYTRLGAMVAALAAAEVALILCLL